MKIKENSIKKSGGSATHDSVGNSYRGNFMALISADYHMTRQHPSKNN